MAKVFNGRTYAEEIKMRDEIDRMISYKKRSRGFSYDDAATLRNISKRDFIGVVYYACYLFFKVRRKITIYLFERKYKKYIKENPM